MRSLCRKKEFPLIRPFHGLQKCVIDGRAAQAPLKVFNKNKCALSWTAVVEVWPASSLLLHTHGTIRHSMNSEPIPIPGPDEQGHVSYAAGSSIKIMLWKCAP